MMAILCAMMPPLVVVAHDLSEFRRALRHNLSRHYSTGTANSRAHRRILNRMNAFFEGT